MPHAMPHLHLFCGKVASGKSTLAAKLGAQAETVTLSEDKWLDALFADQMTSLQDYVRCASNLRSVMSPHITSLLNAGLSVVLDFPANTVENRSWMRQIIDCTNAFHQLHVLDTPDGVCLARLRARNAAGVHPFSVTEDQFHRMTKYFARPSPDEGFNIVMHRWQS